MKMRMERHPLLLCAYAFLLLLLFLIAGACTFFLSTLPLSKTREAIALFDSCVILDAGHGGEDGGAVGANGVLEKDLNLAVAIGIAERLRGAGVEVILTRTEDKLLYGEAGNIKGHRKENDLKNRLAIAAEHPDAIFVSIHMNTFSVPKYSGLQVYYAGTEGSREVATHIQSAVRDRLQPENQRKVHAANSSIYLLDHAVGRAVLVECGFLSNPEECAKLSQKDYQSELCFSIFCGIMEYIKATEGEKA